jgi:hypothetical protein
MIGFKKYLAESLDVDKLKHLEHAEDHIIHGGHEGMAHAFDNLDDVHNILSGKGSKTKVTTKYDGSPSVVFGKHPENNQFFVASKSAFNKNPKLNYTEEDIERNHGHAPGLVSKLKAALNHLPNVMPNEGGVYQGDFLYEKPDVYTDDDHYKFAPNTITYGAHKDSPMGRRIAASKIGFVVHTKYDGNKLDDMKAGFDVDHSRFKQDPSVNLVNPEIKDTKHTHYSDEDRNEYQQHRDKATETYLSMHPSTLSKLGDHNEHIKPYINSTVRNGTTPSADDYSKFLETKRDAEAAKVKTEAAKKKKQDSYNKLISDVTDSGDEFKKALELHGHIQRAKDILVRALGNPTEFSHSVGGSTVKPEGFVAIRGGRPTKLVDRAEFSRMNFANNRGKREADPLHESMLTEEAEPEVHHVFAFGRMNPPTVGHGALVDKVKEVAKAKNAGHSVVISKSQDPKKNPLSPEQKLQHAKRFFPGTNISAATAEQPTFMHYLKQLHNQGVSHVTMVAGSDRIEEYKKLLDRYNGPGKEFNFKNIDVVSAGERDPDADDVSGMSASKMRAHASAGNFAQFRKGIPSHVSDEHAKELFGDVRNGMGIREEVIFEDYLEEVSFRTDITKKAKGFAFKRFLDKPISDVQKKFNKAAKKGLAHHSTMDDGRKVYHGVDDAGHHHYMTSDHEGKVDIAVNTIKQGKSNKIDMAVAKPGSNVHKLYHHLITKHNHIITSDEQSPGGLSIWQRLRKLGGVGIHGYHPKTGRAQHVDLVKHPEDSHVKHDEPETFRKTKGGTRAQRKKEYADIKKTKAMMVVASKNRNIRPRAKTILRTVKESLKV